MSFYQKITPSESVRKSILDFIVDDTESISLVTANENISKTSWKYDTITDSQMKLGEIFKEDLAKIFRDHFGKSYTLTGIWYQVYAKHTGSFHGFHHHLNEESTTSAIFYVKLHSKELLTQFQYDGNVVTPDAQEGDIILFDSGILHASPPNNTDDDKIIVSFNFMLKNDHSKLATP